MTIETIPGTKAVAERIVRAHVNFAATLAERGGIGADDAKAVAAWYLKNKCAKLDAVGGVISVKHGRLLDREVIKRAVEVARNG